LILPQQLAEAQQRVDRLTQEVGRQQQQIKEAEESRLKMNEQLATLNTCLAQTRRLSSSLSFLLLLFSSLLL
jgi:hypothetical protein